jgi:hypothetical protein
MRRVFLYLIGLLVIAAAGYCAWWQYLAWKVGDALGPWAESRRAEGLDVSWDSVRIGGFPFALRLSFDNYRAAGQKPLPFAMSAPRVAFWSAPWNLRLWQFEASQGGRLDVLTASAGFDAQSLTGSVRVPFAEQGALDIEAGGLTGRGAATGYSAAAVSASVAEPPVPPASEHDPFLLVSFAIRNAGLPLAPPPFGSTVQEIAASATINGAVTPGPLPQMLDSWRREGGTIQVTSFSLRWDGLEIRANGTAALDGRLQPIGALTAIIHGQGVLVDAASAAGVLKPDAAQLAKAVLGMVAKPDAAGRPAVTLPLSAQNQKLYLGPAPIARIPVINWE